MIFDGVGEGGIELEIWAVPAREFGSFVALIPAPLGIGTLTLDDGTQVKGFACEAHAAAGAKTSPISEAGGLIWLAGSRHPGRRSRSGLISDRDPG